MTRFSASRLHHIVSAGFVLLCVPALSHATTRTVPLAYPNIQAAINAATNGDAVLVSPGVYSGPGNVNLDPGGRAITIKSAGGSGSCTIDGGGANQIFVIQSGETNKTVISGFTLAHGLGNNGGAMYIASSSPIISNCVFKNNQAVNGGGCYAVVNSTDAPKFSNCTFLHNAAGDGYEPVPSGGGLMVVGGAGAITNCAFISNIARIPANDVSNGGGLMLQSDKTKVVNCAFNNNASWFGGGAQADMNSLAAFSNCTFHANNAYGNGGGVDVTNSANPTFSNCTFSNNYGAFAGGLALFSGLGATVKGCVFDSNTTDFLGAGLGNWGGILNLTNSTFTNNISSGVGGGVWTHSVAKNTITDCTFDSNTALLQGGGICSQGANPIVTGCLFTNNTLTDPNSSGGGAYCNASSTFKGCVFDGNSAVYGGGLAIGGYNSSSTSIVVDTVFENNTASHLAGGVHVEGGTAFITECTFSGNQAVSQPGQGDGICCQASYNLTVGDTILWDSQRGTPGSDFNTDASGTATFTHVDAYDGVYPGVSNLAIDPQFVDPADGDLTLLSASPCLGAGSTKVPDYFNVDIDGAHRNSSKPALGAYEN